MARAIAAVYARLPRSANTGAWLVGAVIAGAVGGTIATSLGAREIAVAIAALGLAALVLWRYEIGVCATLALNSLDIYGRFMSEPVALTWYQVSLLLTLASWGLSWLWRPEERPRFSAVDLGMAALVFAAAWSLPFSLDQRATFVAIVRLAFLWLFVLLYANALSKPRTAEALSWTLMVSASLSSLVTMAQLYVPGFDYGNVLMVSDFGRESLRASAFFDDPNYLAGFLVVSFLTALAFVVHSRSWRRAALAGTALAIVGVGLGLTLSRTGMVGVAVGVLVVAVTAPRDRRWWLLGGLGVAALLLGAVASQSLVDRVRSIGEVSDDKSNSTRIWMFVSTWEMFKERWAFGTGLAAFYKTYPAHRYVQALSDVIRPHEIPLALAAETGVAGIIAQLVLAWGVVVSFVRRRARGWTVYESLALAGIVSLTIQSLFQYYLYFEYLWLFVAFAVAAHRLARNEEVSDV